MFDSVDVSKCDGGMRKHARHACCVRDDAHRTCENPYGPRLRVGEPADA